MGEDKYPSRLNVLGWLWLVAINLSICQSKISALLCAYFRCFASGDRIILVWCCAVIIPILFYFFFCKLYGKFERGKTHYFGLLRGRGARFYHQSSRILFAEEGKQHINLLKPQLHKWIAHFGIYSIANTIRQLNLAKIQQFEFSFALRLIQHMGTILKKLEHFLLHFPNSFETLQVLPFYDGWIWIIAQNFDYCPRLL